jgi:hypothetical protein
MATLDAVTLPEVKAALSIDGTDEDLALARLITAVTLGLEKRLRTQFVQRSVVEYREGHAKRIYLQTCPIASVTSIVDPAGNTVPSTDYIVRQKRWLEHYGCFPYAFTTSGQTTDWTITYTAGWFASTALVSSDVKTEVITAVAAVREQPSANVSSVKVGDLSVSYVESGASSSNKPGGGSDRQQPIYDAAAVALHAYYGVLL